jgi:hypothetical protein
MIPNGKLKPEMMRAATKKPASRGLGVLRNGGLTG